MRILVLGGNGKMGAAVAFDAIKDDGVEVVGLAGRRLEALEQTRAWLGSEKADVHVLDVGDRAAMKALMKRYDVGVITLPDRRTSYLAIHAAAEAGFHIVDMLEEYHRRPDAYETENLALPAGMSLEEYGEWLHVTAQANGATVMDGMGFAPGLSNITVGEGIRKLDTVESAIARVGGIPSKEASLKHPLRYMVTWAFSHVLREYMIKVNVRKGGKVVEVDATTDRERFRFDQLGQDEWLECAVTPGMPSFIFTRPDLGEFAEKTVRWPSHWDSVETLKSCGLLDITPVSFAGASIVPREFLFSLIEPRLRQQPGETDVCVMYNTVVGTRQGVRTKISYYMWDEADTVHGISSMGRVTGFSASIGALLIGRGLIKERGLVPPEDCIYGEVYAQCLAELEKRRIRILEIVEPLG